MSALLQNAAAIAACLAAAAFVSWRAWKAIKGRSGGCGIGCGSCPSSSAKLGMPTVRPLLSIEERADVRLDPGQTRTGKQ